mmetsp:Transcript_5757/g.9863  ORF Transcript_5757/g.9863 Transcript_5757/m.9863 type:complete len:97 (+) Transcript_5757:926-1216(+)
MILKLIALLKGNLDSVSSRSIENTMFFFNRQSQIKIMSVQRELLELQALLMQKVVERESILKGDIRDHLLVLSLIQRLNMHKSPEFEELIQNLLKH